MVCHIILWFPNNLLNNSNATKVIIRSYTVLPLTWVVTSSGPFD